MTAAQDQAAAWNNIWPAPTKVTVLLFSGKSVSAVTVAPSRVVQRSRRGATVDVAEVALRGLFSTAVVRLYPLDRVRPDPAGRITEKAIRGAT